MNVRDNTLEIKIRAIREGVDEIKKTTSRIRNLREAAGKPVPDPTRKLRQGAKETGESLGGTIKMLAQFYLVYEALSVVAHGFEDAVKAGIQFNSQIESSRLGIASLITAESKLTDADGNVLHGHQALAAAMGIAQSQVEKLRIAGLQTTATFEQLADAFQQAVGPGLQAGLTLDQIRKVTVEVVQAAGALGVPQNQISQEVRAILSGTIDMNARVAKALGLTNAMIKNWKAQGTLVENLDKRMHAFNVAGQATAQTFGGLTSNLEDAFSVIAGAAEKPLFDALERNISTALSSIIDTANGKISDSLSGLVAFLQRGSAAVGTFVGDLINGIVSGAQALSTFVSSNAKAIHGLGVTFGAIAQQVGGLLADIGKIIVGVTVWATKSGLLETTFKVIAVAVAGLRDGIDLLGGAVAYVGGKVIDYLATPIGFVLDELAKLADIIPGFSGAGLREIETHIKSIGQAAQAYGDDVFASFVNGDTHVAHTLAQFAKLDNQLKTDTSTAATATSGITAFVHALTQAGSASNADTAAAKQRAAALQKAAQARAQYVESVRRAIDPTRRLREEQVKLDQVYQSGTSDLTADEYVARSKQIQGQIDAIKNKTGKATGQMNQFAVQAARNMQSAFADFLFDPFKDGVKGLVKGFADAVRRMVANALAAELLKKLFGTGAGGSGSNVGGLVSLFGTIASGFHDGGIVGENATFMRQVSPLLFAGAPRYHAGGIAGLAPLEVPAILQRGEEVLARNDPRNSRNGGGAGGGVRIVNVLDPKLAQDYLESSAGERVILNTIQRNGGAVKQMISNS